MRFATGAASDPLNWTSRNGGRPVLTSDVGERGVRDPFLLRTAGLPGERAKYYLMATDLRIRGKEPRTAWTDAVEPVDRRLESQDLIEWTPPRLVEVSPPEAGTPGRRSRPSMPGPDRTSSTGDASAWTLVEPSRLPAGASHGSVLALDAEEWARLAR